MRAACGHAPEFDQDLTIQRSVAFQSDSDLARQERVLTAAEVAVALGILVALARNKSTLRSTK
ncbi:hypothetical protein MPLB_1690037 [Mesorhizobium sp. ORS 3324]|nr:hypothetical protein MPLB_1690037 [Mesorhizobium sp. ORS 3324]